MRLLDRYIGRTVIKSTLMIVFVLIGIQSFLELMGELHHLGTHNYGVLQASAYVALQLPSSIYQMFPIAGFLGCLIGMGKLASASELTVMRASGISIRRISWAVIKAAILMMIIVTFIGEFVAPVLYAKSIDIKAKALDQTIGLQRLRQLWLHSGQRFIYVRNVPSETRVSGVMIYQFNDSNRLQSITLAPTGVRQTSGAWLLKDVTQTDFYATHMAKKQFKTMPLGMKFDPKLLLATKKDTDQDSVKQILHNILYRQSTGLTTNQFEFAFWQRLIQPITTIVMICLGVPFVFGSLRSSSIAVRLLTGIIIGFCFYMMNQFFGPISLVYQFPPFWAAALPTIVFILVYLFMIRRVST